MSFNFSHFVVSTLGKLFETFFQRDLTPRLFEKMWIFHLNFRIHDHFVIRSSKLYFRSFTINFTKTISSKISSNSYFKMCYHNITNNSSKLFHSLADFNYLVWNFVFLVTSCFLDKDFWKFSLILFRQKWRRKYQTYVSVINSQIQKNDDLWWLQIYEFKISELFQTCWKWIRKKFFES